MRNLLRFLVLLATMLFWQSASADSFIEGMDDIPLMPGMKQLQSDTISFGNADSHFLEAVLEEETEGSSLDYRLYYMETLPQLGWEFKKEKGLKFVFYRGEETLEITQEYAKPLTIRINIFGEN